MMLDALNTGAEPDYRALYLAALDQWPAVVYHTAPVDRRAQIELDGLLALMPGGPNSNWPDDIGQPAGVYVAAEPDLVGKWAHAPTIDIWAVATPGLAHVIDHMNPGCWCITSNVPSDRLTLIKKEHDPCQPNP